MTKTTDHNPRPPTRSEAGKRTDRANLYDEMDSDTESNRSNGAGSSQTLRRGISQEDDDDEGLVRDGSKSASKPSGTMPDDHIDQPRIRISRDPG